MAECPPNCITCHPDHEAPDPEVIYAIRRADGEPMGDFSFTVTGSATDWSPAEDDAEYGEAVTYELVMMDVTVVGRRTLPTCKECEEPARFWGLCETHAREDDPEYFAQHHRASH